MGKGLLISFTGALLCILLLSPAMAEAAIICGGGGINVSLTEVRQCTVLACPSGATSGYDFIYFVSGSEVNKISRSLASQACPDYPNDPANKIDGSTGCGKGDTATGREVGVYHSNLRVVTEQPFGQAGQPQLVLNAPLKQFGYISFSFKAGNKFYTCDRPELGPGSLNPVATVTSTRRFTLPPIQGGEVECVLEVNYGPPITAEIVSGTCQATNGFQPIGTNNPNKKHVSDDAIEVTTSSPTCYTYYWNGREKTFCQ